MRVSPTIRNLSLASAVLSIAAAGLLLAQQQYPPDQQPYPPQQQQDPYYGDQQQQQQQQVPFDDNEPGRGVARISLTNGEVNFKRGDTNDVIAAQINAPLMAGDSLLTGPGARAEIQFDSANALRMSATSEVRMSELEWQRYMIQLADGTVTFRTLRNSNAQVEINTPAVAIRPLKKGEYRISVYEDGTTEITVRSGEVEVFTPRGSEKLKSGKKMLARAVQGGEPEFQVSSAPARDEFDMWNQDRDRYMERSASYGQMSQDIYGAEDLDANGTWQNSQQYGNVWVPNGVGQDWAPYQDGRWVYYDYYGWTWVSNDSWGWAPYHYGRWFNDPSLGWAWWPGQRGGRHFWRPAYVSFFGWGNRGGFNLSVGFGFGNVGWVPLAPFEPCYGWWGRNRYNNWGNGRFYNNTMIVNNINVVNVYRNARVRNGVTSMAAGDFGRGRVYGGNMVRGRMDDYRGAGMVRGNLPLVPDRQASVRLNDRGAGSFQGRGAENMRFAQTRQPAAVNRVSFEDQRRGTQELARRSFGGGVASQADGARQSFGDNGSRDNVNTGGGWRRSGGSGDGGSTMNPNINGQMQRGSQGADRSNGGWRSFGESRRREGGETASPRVGGMETLRQRQPRDSQMQRQESPQAGNDGWGRFGSSGRGSGIGDQQQQQQQQRQNVWRDQQRQQQEQQQRSMERMQQQQQQRQRDQVRISPPIVRDRGASSESRGSFGGGGSFGRGGNVERQSAPRMDRGSGGGGGFSRGSESRGGGGSRSGGGGGGGGGRGGRGR